MTPHRITRRTLLGAGLVLATPRGVGLRTGRRRSAAGAPPTFVLRIANDGAVAVAVTVIGLDEDGRLTVLGPDGEPLRPPDPGAELTPLDGADGVVVGAGTSADVTVPRLTSARAFVSTDGPLTYFVNPGPRGPALVSPSHVAPDDLNAERDWGFMEFTLDRTQLYANVSAVDFVAVPIGLQLDTLSGSSDHVAGLPAGAVDSLADGLHEQEAADGAAWSSLVVTGADGAVRRVLSPTNRATELGGYLDEYVTTAWAAYADADLRIDTQNAALGHDGIVTGRYDGAALSFDSGDRVARAATVDVWTCDSGPFDLGPTADDTVDGNTTRAIVARLAAALNRTTLHRNPDQPDGERAATFYAEPATNHYARLVHDLLPDDRGYAFPYDDVGPLGVDFSGAVHAADPDVLTMTVRDLHRP